MICVRVVMMGDLWTIQGDDCPVMQALWRSALTLRPEPEFLRLCFDAEEIMGIELAWRCGTRTATTKEIADVRETAYFAYRAAECDAWRAVFLRRHAA